MGTVRVMMTMAAACGACWGGLCAGDSGTSKEHDLLGVSYG